jgi:hypothetical protein
VGNCSAATANVTLTETSELSVTTTTSACVRIVPPTSWSTINPQFRGQPGTTGYPVPLSYSYCSGNGTRSLPGDYTSVFLLPSMIANPHCDIFVKFNGSGGTLKFDFNH